MAEHRTKPGCTVPPKSALWGSAVFI